jgi:biopolymer transport protein ExbD
VISTRIRPGFRTPSEAAEVAIDVTPVMNVFIILIPFLVSMAVFTHLAVHRFSLPADDGPGVARTADELPITVVLADDRIAIARGDRILATSERSASGYDYAAFEEALREWRGRLPDVARVVVAVDDPVVCADVVTCLDRCRDAGFTDVALAGGTNLDRGGRKETP